MDRTDPTLRWRDIAEVLSTRAPEGAVTTEPAMPKLTPPASANVTAERF